MDRRNFLAGAAVAAGAAALTGMTGCYWSQVKSATPKSEINRQSRPI
ncbi:twin-arginine translocation signal domain-containing protein [Adlercreutzia sp. DFI.6.23]